MAVRLLLDNSAWARLGAEFGLAARRRGQLADQLAMRDSGDVEQHAPDAHRELARVGHHRLPPADFDAIRRRTSLQFESVWLARRGSL